MKLKTWQKWGIVFGVMHIIIIFIIIYSSRGTSGCSSPLLLLPYIDYPISIVSYYLEKLFNHYSIYNFSENASTFYAISYHLIFGTIFYFIVGSLLGAITKLIGRKMVWVLKIGLLCIGLYFIVLYFESVALHLQVAPIVLFFSGIITCLISISSLFYKKGMYDYKMKLNTWQKWGISFGVFHILILLCYVLFVNIGMADNFTKISYYLPAILEAPVNYIGVELVPDKFSGILDHRIFFYFIITGTVFYSMLGSLIGIFVKTLGKYFAKNDPKV